MKQFSVHLLKNVRYKTECEISKLLNKVLKIIERINVLTAEDLVFFKFSLITVDVEGRFFKYLLGLLFLFLLI